MGDASPLIGAGTGDVGGRVAVVVCSSCEAGGRPSALNLCAAAPTRGGSRAGGVRAKHFGREQRDEFLILITRGHSHRPIVYL